MKKIFFPLLLLLSIGTTVQGKHNHVQLTHPALRLIDGFTPGMDADSIVDCLQVRNLINTLQYGEPHFETRTFVKKYNLSDKKVSLNDLVKLETEFIEKNLSHNDVLYKQLLDCLALMKDEFITFTKPLLGQAELKRNATMKLIHEWCEKKDRHDSLLLSWGTVDEERTLREASTREFHQFTIDLRDFLQDLMYSCPKGRNKYKKEHLDPNKWDKFDKSFS